MIAVIFEVEPRPRKKDAYLEIAARLRPQDSPAAHGA